MQKSRNAQGKSRSFHTAGHTAGGHSAGSRSANGKPPGKGRPADGKHGRTGHSDKPDFGEGKTRRAEGKRAPYDSNKRGGDKHGSAKPGRPAFGGKSGAPSDRRDGTRDGAGQDNRAAGKRSYSDHKSARPAFAGKRAAPQYRDETGDEAPVRAPRFPNKTPYDKRPRHDRTERSRTLERAASPAPFVKPLHKPQQKPLLGAKPKPALPARQSYGQLLHGLHAVSEAWLNPARRCHQLWLTPAAETAFAPTLAAAIAAELERPAPLPADRDTLDAMLPGALHQGIALDAAPLPELTLADLLAKQPRLLVLLDQVTDPHNVGAILRSAAAFGADGVILTERHAPGLTGTLAKSASGALEHVPLVAVVNLARALAELRDAGFWCVGLAEEGEKPLGEHDLSGATALVLGAEGEGLRRLTRERCDALALLPTQGAISSLNVSNAAAIALYEAKRQRSHNMVKNTESSQ
ncbi:MAG: 23S rRNA (guanosine(2251)-2'-O)-methyltransferase RlmB [Alphaproteobacteria bacterium]|nr:23S rRNA (guanosine(2251)-2'-O)-methyltransferase RlmB [Alphaproteobacteria bacterium]